MKHATKFALLLALLVIPSSAIAYTNPLEECTTQTTLINNLAINATRTASFAATDRHTTAVMYLDLTRSTATAVTMACTSSDDGGTTNFALQECAVSAGVCTSTDKSWSNAVSANEQWVWRVDVAGLKQLDCNIDGTAAGAGDLITVTGYLCTGAGMSDGS